MCVSGNDIEDAGGTAVAEALEVNTTVQKIHLFGEWCAGGACQMCMCGSGAYQVCVCPSVCVLVCVLVCACGGVCQTMT